MITSRKFLKTLAIFGLLLIPLEALALEDTSRQLIQWIMGLVFFIFLLIAIFQLIPFLIYHLRAKKTERIPEVQRTDEQISQFVLSARKAKLRLKIMIIFIGAAAGLFVIYFILFFQSGSVVVNPCRENLGWENTPCTENHETASTKVVEAINTGLFRSSMNILSWDTNQGRIYWVGMVSPGDLYECVSFHTVTDGTFGTYYNAQGMTIASCTSGYNKNPKICSWLNNLKLSEADYSDPECR
jgi:MFS family permease